MGNKTLTDGLIDRRAGGVNRFAVNRREIKHCCRAEASDKIHQL